MNKLWIDHSHKDVNDRRNGFPIEEGQLSRYEFLDMLGLLETSWMIYEHVPLDADYGYPGNE